QVDRWWRRQVCGNDRALARFRQSVRLFDLCVDLGRRADVAHPLVSRQVLAVCFSGLGMGRTPAPARRRNSLRYRALCRRADRLPAKRMDGAARWIIASRTAPARPTIYTEAWAMPSRTTSASAAA